MPELSIRKIIEKTLSGEIRIPSFQRGFVWEPEKVAFFIDSLYKGYPIGSLYLCKYSYVQPITCCVLPP